MGQGQLQFLFLILGLFRPSTTVAGRHHHDSALQQTLGRYNNDSNDDVQYDDMPRTRDDQHQGLAVLFDMLSIFLNDVVQPKTLGELMTEYNITRFSDFTEDEFVDDWQSWIWYIMGFLACLAAGVVFILVMPVSGCCYAFGSCCCGGCCGCGRFCRCKKKKKKKSGAEEAGGEEEEEEEEEEEDGAVQDVHMLVAGPGHYQHYAGKCCLRLHHQ